MRAERPGSTWRRVVVTALVMVTLLPACSGGAGPGDGSTAGSGAQTSAPATTGSQEPASTTGPSTTMPLDHREAILDVLGPPDAFRVEVHVLDGHQVVVMSLTYGELARRFDLIDGLVTGSEGIEPFPAGTLFPHQYGLDDVWPGMAVADVRQRLEGVDLREIDGSALGLPGGTVLAAGQLALAFADGLLVYAETFPLVPDADGAYQAYQAGSAP